MQLAAYFARQGRAYREYLTVLSKLGGDLHEFQHRYANAADAGLPSALLGLREH